MGYIWTEQYDTGTVAFIIISAAMVFIMVPGLALLYSGLTRRKSALSLVWTCIMAGAVGIVQWYFWGYSLAFSGTATNGYIGNLDAFGFRNVYATEDSAYPELAFALFQNMFLCVTLAIIAGAVAEKGRVLPHVVFLFLWATLVYCPIACWVWNPNGWAYKWGVLDFAGGGPVEIGSGLAGFVYSWFLGERKERVLVRPNSVQTIVIGTSLLWFGWIGFNGGTALYPNLRAVYTVMNTNITAAVGGMTWCLLDYRLERKWSTVGLCSGIISGLVAATPSSGNITLYGSVVLGIVSGVVCNFSTGLKYLVGDIDSLDLLAEHFMAGIVGLFFNALFGADWVIGMDGITDHPGGFISKNWKQIYKQIAYIAATTGYVGVVTAILCFVIDKIPGLKLRASEEAQIAGMDEDQIGEFAYDYIEVRRDFLTWGSSQYDPNDTIPQVDAVQVKKAPQTDQSTGESTNEKSEVQQ